MKHSAGHIMEMSWSFATEWIRGIHMFEYRLLRDLPEDKFFAHKVFRDDIDFHCLLISCRRLERAITMAYNVWDEKAEKQEIKNALEKFKARTPYLAVSRNVGEHFDDYLMQRGKDKSMDSRGIRVYSTEFEKSKKYKVRWLDYKIDLRHITKAADGLHKEFIKIYKQAVARRKTLRTNLKET